MARPRLLDGIADRNERVPSALVVHRLKPVEGGEPARDLRPAPLTAVVRRRLQALLQRGERFWRQDRRLGAVVHALVAEAPMETKAPEAKPTTRDVWMRGLFMLVFIIAFWAGQCLLNLLAIVQFIWLLAAREPNQFIARFGNSLSTWLGKSDASSPAPPTVSRSRGDRGPRQAPRPLPLPLSDTPRPTVRRPCPSGNNRGAVCTTLERSTLPMWHSHPLAAGGLLPLGGTTMVARRRPRTAIDRSWDSCFKERQAYGLNALSALPQRRSA